MKFRHLGQLPEAEFWPADIGNIYWGMNEGFMCIGSQAPTVDELDSGVLRVYFSARDAWGRSHPFYYDVLKSNPLKILYTGEVPIPLGEPGSPDELGVMISHVWHRWIYYTGWGNHPTERYKTTSMEFDTKTKEKRIMFNDSMFPNGTSMPFLCWDTILFMGFTEWVNGEPFYAIYRDDDSGEPTLELPLGPNEGGLARPVSFDNDRYIFFSSRGKFNYRTDPAETYKLKVADLDSRNDNTKVVVHNITIEGDNNHMKAYGYPIKVDNKTYLFYNSGSFTSPIHVATEV